MSRYADALWMPNSNAFANRNGQRPRYIIIHATAGGASAQNIATYFQNTQGTANPVSAHYVIGQDGTIVCCNDENDGAWANGLLTAGHDAFWDASINPNNLTVAIEHVKPSLDNSDSLTPAQQAASFKLIADICTRLGIPKQPANATGGITGHYSIDPVNRKQCPGNYPWQALWDYLKGPTVATPTTHGKEVGTFIDADQFQPAKSQGECGCFSVALCKAMGAPGHPAMQTVPQVIAEAEGWYQQLEGDNSINTYVGLTQDQVMALLTQQGLTSAVLDPHAASIQAKVAAGYPVIICATEASIVDMALGRNPYPWIPAGNHIFVVTGVRDDGNFLVRDTANCTNLYDPNSLRAGPRSYTMGMEKLWAVAVTPPWLAQEDELLQLTDPMGTYFVADGQNWKLKSNGAIELKGAILMYYRMIQGACRLPVTPEQYNVPGLVWQRFESGIIVYDPQQQLDGFQGGHNHTYLLKLDSPLAQQILGTTALSAQVKQLQQQIAAQSNVNVTLLQTQITTLQAKLNQIKTLVS